MTVLSVYKKYLPSGCEIQHLARGETTLSLLKEKNEILAWGANRDPRLASLQAVGRYLQKAIPSQMDWIPLPHSAWGYGIQAAAARTTSLLNAVHRWAWNHWQQNSNILVPVKIHEFVSMDTCVMWLPQLTQVWAWNASLSFFEQQAGILHLKFTILAMQDASGRSYLASHLCHENEEPWLEAMAHLWWQSQTYKTADEVMFRTLMNNAGTLPWPAIRIPAVQSYDLSEPPVELPGFLCCASAQGEPAAEGVCS